MAENIRMTARAAGARLASLPIHFYRYAISPFLPRDCRFEPSCSKYALEAIELHGPVHGTWLAMKRLSHCHPISWLGGRSASIPCRL